MMKVITHLNVSPPAQPINVDIRKPYNDRCLKLLIEDDGSIREVRWL